MAITMQYRITVRCDVCRKKDVMEYTGSPPPQSVPVSWIQTAPPGQTAQKEFCSVECLNNWENDVKPWDEDVDGD